MKRTFSQKNLKDDIESGTVPQYLFKYYPINVFLLKTLLNKELWYSSPLNFNDPWDCQIEEQTDWSQEKVFEYLKKYGNEGEYDIPKINAKFNEDNSWFNLLLTNTVESVIRKIGVACFSENSKNYLLWSHYADGHKGVCLKFDLLKDTNHFLGVMDVIYTDEYPKFQLENLESFDSDSILRTKSDNWLYEEEWRNFKQSSGNYLFNPECLVEVTLGMKINKDDAKAIGKIFELSEYKHVIKRQAKKSPTKFEIDLE